MNPFGTQMFRGECYFFENARKQSDRIFGSMKSRLFHELFVIGFNDSGDGKPPIHIVPPACSLTTDHFINVSSNAKQLAQNEQVNILNVLMTSQEIENHRIQMESVRNAIDSRMTQLDSQAGNVLSYVSFPVKIGNYTTAVVIRFLKDVFDGLYKFQKGYGMTSNMQIPKSFLEATIFSLLQSLHETLLVPDPDQINAGAYDDEIMRRAGRMMMRTPFLSINTASGMPDLFETCQLLSALKYEGKDGAGRIIFATRGHESIETKVAFTKPRLLQDTRSARKMLEMTSNNLSLLCDTEYVYGLGNVLSNYNPASQKVFEVQFLSQAVWEFKHAGNTMMHVTHGIPQLSGYEFSASGFKATLTQCFPNLGATALERLCTITALFTSKKHGCVLAITPQAASETIRLSNQCIGIEPQILDNSLISAITEIDGAVLVDHEARCHAVGVILDGPAHERCNPGRGSRYNSALRYAYGHKSECVVLVKSDDGMVDSFGMMPINAQLTPP
ncbi:MAG: diadenylate cyclase [Gemmatales bacterium]